MVIPLAMPSKFDQVTLYKSSKFEPLVYVDKFVPSFEDTDESIIFCNLSEVVHKYNLWRKLFPRIKFFYAVKCNYDEMILRVLVQMGSSFDCASKGELETMIGLGVDPSKIIFAHPVKYITHLDYAKEKGVDLMTVDRSSELKKIKTYYPEAKLVLRIRYDAKSYLWVLGTKYGCDPYQEANDLLDEAKKLKLNVCGIAFHVGSGCKDFETYAEAIAVARNVFDYGLKLGFNMNLLDIGGGFPGGSDKEMGNYVTVINKAIEEHFPEPEIQIIAEPGQYLCTSAFKLFATVLSERKIKDNESTKTEYLINDGFFHSFRSAPEMFEFVTVDCVRRKKIEDREEKCSMVGHSLDGTDIVAENYRMPVLGVGDQICFNNMGAYSVSLNTKFNGFRRPLIHYFMHQKDYDNICENW